MCPGGSNWSTYLVTAHARWVLGAGGGMSCAPPDVEQDSQHRTAVSMSVLVVLSHLCRVTCTVVTGRSEASAASSCRSQGPLHSFFPAKGCFWKQLDST